MRGAISLSLTEAAAPRTPARTPAAALWEASETLPTSDRPSLRSSFSRLRLPGFTASAAAAAALSASTLAASLAASASPARNAGRALERSQRHVYGPTPAGSSTAAANAAVRAWARATISSPAAAARRAICSPAAAILFARSLAEG